MASASLLSLFQLFFTISRHKNKKTKIIIWLSRGPNGSMAALTSGNTLRLRTPPSHGIAITRHFKHSNHTKQKGF